MLPRTAVHWLSSVEVGAEFGVEQYDTNTDIGLIRFLEAVLKRREEKDECL